jgi:hypothetical protein
MRGFHYEETKQVETHRHHRLRIAEDVFQPVKKKHGNSSGFTE